MGGGGWGAGGDELMANTNSLLLQQRAKFLALATEHGVGILLTDASSLELSRV